MKITNMFCSTDYMICAIIIYDLYNHNVGLYRINKISLLYYDDKRCTLKFIIFHKYTC